MKAEFYSLKAKKKIEVEVIGKRKAANGKCQIVGQDATGINMYRIVSEADYKTKYASVKVVK